MESKSKIENPENPENPGWRCADPGLSYVTPSGYVADPRCPTLVSDWRIRNSAGFGNPAGTGERGNVAESTCCQPLGNFQKRISHYICRSATPSAFLTTKHTKHTKYTKKAKIVSIYRIFPYFLYSCISCISCIFCIFFVCFVYFVVKKAAAGDIRQFSDRCSVGYPFLEIALIRFVN